MSNAELRAELVRLVEEHQQGRADNRETLREMERNASGWRERQQVRNAMRFCG